MEECQLPETKLLQYVCQACCGAVSTRFKKEKDLSIHFNFCVFEFGFQFFFIIFLLMLL